MAQQQRGLESMPNEILDLVFEHTVELDAPVITSKKLKMLPRLFPTDHKTSGFCVTSELTLKLQSIRLRAEYYKFLQRHMMTKETAIRARVADLNFSNMIQFLNDTERKQGDLTKLSVGSDSPTTATRYMIQIEHEVTSRLDFPSSTLNTWCRKTNTLLKNSICLDTQHVIGKADTIACEKFISACGALRASRFAKEQLGKIVFEIREATLHKALGRDVEREYYEPTRTVGAFAAANVPPVPAPALLAPAPPALAHIIPANYLPAPLLPPAYNTGPVLGNLAWNALFAANGSALPGVFQHYPANIHGAGILSGLQLHPGTIYGGGFGAVQPHWGAGAMYQQGGDEDEDVEMEDEDGGGDGDGDVVMESDDDM